MKKRSLSNEAESLKKKIQKFEKIPIKLKRKCFEQEIEKNEIVLDSIKIRIALSFVRESWNKDFLFGPRLIQTIGYSTDEEETSNDEFHQIIRCVQPEFIAVDKDLGDWNCWFNDEDYEEEFHDWKLQDLDSLFEEKYGIKYPEKLTFIENFEFNVIMEVETDSDCFYLSENKNNDLFNVFEIEIKFNRYIRKGAFLKHISKLFPTEKSNFLICALSKFSELSKKENCFTIYKFQKKK